MNKKILKIGLMIGYLLFFILMDFWVITIQNSFITKEPLSTIFYFSRYRGMILIGFFKWFVLGFLLHFLSERKKLRFKVDIIYLAIAIMCAAIYYMINFCILVPIPTIYSGKYMIQLMCLIPILSGFFMFEGLFSNETSS
ncbi:hypothetical protein ACIZ62_14695 [Acetobacterium carbinolicum]|uniref:hypothetical protein n=1 Tax=Acetobacterium carbinolicum TaxID=52690 RepID=UPI0039BED359